MHSRNSLDPIPLQESVSMDLISYPELPEYFGIMSYHNPPAYFYGGYQQRGMKAYEYESISPHDNDILMGRGGKNNQHVGNEKLRKLARKEAKEYSISSKKGKSTIARGLVTKVRQMQPAGRFLKKNPITSEWEDVGDDYAREKASQVLRDAVALLPGADGNGDKNKNDEDGEAPLVLAVENKPNDENKPAAKIDTNRGLKRKATSSHAQSNYLISCNGVSKEACQFHAMSQLPMPALEREQSSYKNVPQTCQFQLTMPALKREQSSYKNISQTYQFQLSMPAFNRQQSSYKNVPQACQFQATMPAFKRHRSNNFFEYSDFFAASGKCDPNRSLGGPFPASPCLSRQGSLCASVGGGSLPGILLDEKDIAELAKSSTELLAPPSLESSPSDAFFSEFY